MGESPVAQSFRFNENFAETVFEELDTDRNGVLCMREILCALNDAGVDDDELEGLFLALDKDSSGVIDRGEFVEGFALYQQALEHGNQWSLEDGLENTSIEKEILCEYRVGRKIGMGAFSTVSIARNRR